MRLLDFEESHASDKEIGKYLFPNKSDDALRDMINKSVEAAHNWRDNYLLIALHSPVGSGGRTRTEAG